MCCLQDHTHKHTVCSQKQSHAAIHPSATTAFTFCHHSRGMAPQHYGYFPVLSAFRWEIKSVKRVRETKKGESGRQTAWCTRELTEGVTDALDQKRREHVTGGSQAPHTNTPSLKKGRVTMVTGGGYKRRGWESSLLMENYLFWHSCRCTHVAPCVI